MKKISSYLFILLSFYTCSKAQENQYNKDSFFTIVSYNVENLFDTIDDPNKDDNEFLPGSKSEWNSDRYQKKIKNLAQVISSINKNELPELVGLVEIENENVVQDLINYKFLISGNYGIVHHDSPDERGIDVALIYRKDEFWIIDYKAINVFYDFEPKTKTRDILYVKGKLKNGEILHVFLNHWSSRRDGEETSEPKRLYTAKLLRSKCDSIFLKEKKAKIIIMGDFNDEPTNKSLSQVLMANENQDPKNNSQLTNLMYDKHLFGHGTYYYKGNWNMLDNMIVSQALFNSPGKYQVSYDGCQIFTARWMMYDNVKTGELTPNRTYNGSNYLGGYSDHLPIYMILKK
jgi:predicted extracellular nuclease